MFLCKKGRGRKERGRLLAPRNAELDDNPKLIDANPTDTAEFFVLIWLCWRWNGED
jgi:hypothetical protein